MKMQEIDERVQAGAAWLDANAPEGWVNSIALPYLDINSPSRCVLGQLFEDRKEWVNGYYFALMNMMAGDQEMAMDLGFNALRGEYEERVAEMPVLTEAWRRYITAKREELALAA